MLSHTRPIGRLILLWAAVVLLALLFLAVSQMASADGTVLVSLGDDLLVQEDADVDFLPWVSYNGASSALVYTWDFGDGSTSHQTAPTHSWTKAGNYTVSLNVVDGDGTQGSDSIYVEVLNVRPIAKAGSSRTVYEGTTVTFDASESWDTSSDLPLLTYSWDFGDGTATAPSKDNKIVTHAYAERGVYIVRLVVTDDDWVESSHAEFASQLVTVTGSASGNGTLSFFFDVGNGTGASDVNGTDTFDYTFYWDFGDGSSATGNSASHTYDDDGVYVVTFVITNNIGAMDLFTLIVTVLNVPPTANAGPDMTADEDEVLTFSGAGSDPGGGPLTYSWDFGDGSTSAMQEAEHAYTDAGTYTATLIVIDDDGATATDTLSVVVSNVAPTAAFTTDSTAAEGEVITFTATTTTDTESDLPLLTYTWDFGDGSTGSGVTVTHAFADEGTYTTTLTVKDDDGATSTTTLALTVSNAAPVASITSVTGSRTPFIEGDTLTFTGSGTDAGTSDVLSYSWSFGDSSTATGSTTTHAYSTAGNYTVTLTVTDNDGGVGTTTTTVSVTTPQGAASEASTIVTDAPTTSFSKSPDQSFLAGWFETLANDIADGKIKQALKDIETIRDQIDKRVTDSTLKQQLLDYLDTIEEELTG